jgi:hypothetical protein
MGIKMLWVIYWMLHISRAGIIVPVDHYQEKNVKL